MNFMLKRSCLLVYLLVFEVSFLKAGDTKVGESKLRFIQSILNLGDDYPLSLEDSESFKFNPRYHGDYEMSDDRCFINKFGQKDNGELVSFRFSEEMEIIDCKKKEVLPKSVSIFRNKDDRLVAQYAEIDPIQKKMTYYQECWQPSGIKNDFAPLHCSVANNETCKNSMSPSFSWSKDFRILQDSQRSVAKGIFEREFPPANILKRASVSFGKYKIEDSFENKSPDLYAEVLSEVVIRFKNACVEIMGMEYEKQEIDGFAKKSRSKKRDKHKL
ncbi:MAG: hypothetical protein KA116_07690 [Proteobacteria bacterium]|nr:hypothetical protein [Pseudomonadota bacterium]